MRQSKSTPGERIVKDIKRKTRKQYSAEEKIRIVLDGLRGEEAKTAGAVSETRSMAPRAADLIIRIKTSI